MAGTSSDKGSRSRQKTKVVEVPSVDSFGRKQPQQLDFEAAVLGALLVEQDAYYRVSNFLKPDAFYDHRHQLIYDAIQSLAVSQRPVDVLTVPQYLQTQGKLEEAGGAYYVAGLAQNVVTSAHIEYQAKILMQKYQARRLITFASRVSRDAFDETTDVADLMQFAEASLFELSQQTQTSSYTQINPIIHQAYDQLQKAAQRSDGLSGLASGFEDLDRKTSGWQNSDLIIVAARPAMGKTAFMLSMIKQMAVDQHVPVAMFSLEMSSVQLVNRLIVNVCEIPGEKIKSGQLRPDEWNQLDSRISQLIDAPIFVDDTPSLSIFELRTKARRLVREHSVRAIMIDYLQLMNASGVNFGSRQEEVSTISRNLKALAKELDIPVIALSQLNRGVENREGNEGKRPQLSDLRESGAIEQDADMVCFIHRPEYYKIYEDDRGNDLRGKAEIIIAKHRNGPVGEVLLTFQAQFARFQNLTDSSYVPLPGESSVVARMQKDEIDAINSMNVNIPLDSDSLDLPSGPDAPPPY
ncbi:MAG: replicative DNA helicase [Prevotellaceae bacterium]|nr:replicative DNA helicase [Prevotellaceae bacterium]